MKQTEFEFQPRESDRNVGRLALGPEEREIMAILAEEMEGVEEDWGGETMEGDTSGSTPRTKDGAFVFFTRAIWSSPYDWMGALPRGGEGEEEEEEEEEDVMSQLTL
jgi:hypothetical protein